MLTRKLVALLFAIGVVFGGTFAQQETPPAEQPTQPTEPVQPGTPADDQPATPGAPGEGAQEPSQAPEAPGGTPAPGAPAQPTDPAAPGMPGTPDATFGGDDFFTTLTANPELARFAQAFQTAGIEQHLAMLGEEEQWTVFAPGDSVVFEQADLGTQEAMSVYVVRGAYSYDDLFQMAQEQGGSATLTTLDDQEITVEILGDMLLVAGVAQITEQDIQAANGYVHVIDALIQPTFTPGG
jgi:hypothetical protein